MKFEKGFVRSKVARRILVGFISCAILPVSGLALISFGQLEKRLLEQSERELRLTSKAVGLAIVERLSFLEAEMEIWAEKVRTGSSESVPFPGSFEHKLDRFSSLSLVTETGAIRPLTGPVESVPELSPAQQRHIDLGRATVTTRVRDGGGPAWLFMHRAVEAGNPGWGTLVGEINPSYLWGEEFSPSYSPIVGLGVLDSHRNLIFCSLPVDGAGEEEIANEVFSAVQGEFEWALKGRDYLATYWSIPLEYALLVPEWKVTLFKPRDEVFAPMATFKSTLVLFFVLTVLVVMLLSSVQIRKCLVPLVRLKEGTVRVAAREFHSRIDVKSGDEFEELADSFNAMAGQLSKQFDTLTTMSDIDRKILSVLDTGEIIQSVVTLLPRVLACDAVSMTLFTGGNTSSVETYVGDGDGGTVRRVEIARPPDEELERFSDRPEYVTIAAGESSPSWLQHLSERGCESFLLFPVILKGELTGIIALGHRTAPEYSRDDLTQARRVVTQVAIALSNANLVVKLETANKVKSNFLANMSHELRTPLNAILGYAELLRMHLMEDASALEDLEIIDRNGRHLLDLINDVLDISKIEALQLETECVASPPLGILKEVLASVEVWAREKGLVVGYRCDTPIPQQLYSDPTRIHQVLNNLVGNAIKFTESGSVAVLMRVYEDEHDQSWLEFCVRDTGIGIPKDKLESLFEPFTQVDPSFTRKYGGTGLGLSISYRLARLLGGSLAVETELGQGTAFTFTLPCKTPDGIKMIFDSGGLELAEEKSPKAAERIELRGKILVVEDTPESRQLVRAFLQESGASVGVASSGEEAVQLCSEHEFDLILMDIHMPNMDGFETLAALRERDVKTPAVALTAHAMKGDRERCLEAGFADYLSKPVRSSLLLKTLAPYLAEATERGEETAYSEASDVA